MHVNLPILLLGGAFTAGNALRHEHSTRSNLDLLVRDLIFDELDVRGFDIDDLWEDHLFERDLYGRDLFNNDELDFWIRGDEVPSFNIQSATPAEKPKTPPQVFSGPRMGNEQYYTGPKKPAYIPSDNPSTKPKGYPSPLKMEPLKGLSSLPKLLTPGKAAGKAAGK